MNIVSSITDQRFEPELSEEERKAMVDYAYQILMRPGTSEYSIQVMFNPAIFAYLPLGTTDKLASPTFPVPISFYYGRMDWVR